MMNRHFTTASQEAGVSMLASHCLRPVQEVGAEVSGVGQGGAEVKQDIKISDRELGGIESLSTSLILYFII